MKCFTLGSALDPRAAQTSSRAAQHSNSSPQRAALQAFLGLNPQPWRGLGTRTTSPLGTSLFQVAPITSGGLVYVQSLWLVKAKSEGAGSGAVTCNCQSVHEDLQGMETLLWPGVGQGNRDPAARRHWRMTGTRPRVRGVQSMSGKW